MTGYRLVGANHYAVRTKRTSLLLLSRELAIGITGRGWPRPAGASGLTTGRPMHQVFSTNLHTFSADSQRHHPNETRNRAPNKAEPINLHTWDGGKLLRPQDLSGDALSLRLSLPFHEPAHRQLSRKPTQRQSPHSTTISSNSPTPALSVFRREQLPEGCAFVLSVFDGHDGCASVGT